jgi:hypothetical protein
MALSDCTTIEFNSLVYNVRPLERFNGPTFIRSRNLRLQNDGFINSNAIAFIVEDSTNDISINTLFDKNYISFLNKIEKEYYLYNPEITFQVIKDKFSMIYNDLNKFNFEKMSVEFTHDNALVFAIKNNSNKYLLQYFINYNVNSEDDVEVIFSNLSQNSNNFTEVRLEQVKSLLEQEIYSEVIA